jgi:hypothetical protein
MVKEGTRIDISQRPELVRLVEEAHARNASLVLRQESEDVAILRPLRRTRTPRGPRGKSFTKGDPIWNLCGIGRSGVHDVSENVDRDLAAAALDTHGAAE